MSRYLHSFCTFFLFSYSVFDIKINMLHNFLHAKIKQILSLAKSHHYSYFAFIILSFFFVTFDNSYANDKDVIIKELQEMDQITKNKQDDFTKPSLPEMKEEEGLEKMKETKIPEEVGKVEVTIEHINFSGNNVIPSEKLTPYLQNILGKKTTIKEIYKQLDMLSNDYQNKGYVLFHAYLPPQTIEHGKLTVGIIEGHMHDIEMTGETSLKSQVEPMLVSLLERPIFNVHELESALTKVNRLSGIAVTSTIRPIKDTSLAPGSVTLIVDAKRLPNTVTASFNNFGSSNTARYQTSLHHQRYGLFSSADSHNLNLLSSMFPARRLQYMYYAYEHPIGISGLTSSTSVGLGYTRNPHLLGVLSFKSRSASYATILKYPLFQSRRQAVSIFGGLNVNNNYTSMLNTPIVQERIRTFEFGVTGYMADGWRGVNTLRLASAYALAVGGASTYRSALKSRYNANPNFAHYNLVYHRLQAIEENTDLLLETQAQYSRVPLYAGEEIGYGGDRVGRGYENYTISGDKGYTALLELRHRTTNPKDALQAQLFTYLDYGRLWNIDALFGNSKSKASSFGFGVRHSYEESFSSNLYIAFPVSHHAPNGFISDKPRVGFSSQWHW